MSYNQNPHLRSSSYKSERPSYHNSSRQSRQSKDNPHYYEPVSNILFCVNFPENFTAHQLEQLFSQFGKIQSRDIIYNPRKNVKPYAFVQYKDVSSAIEAKKKMNNRLIQGFKMVVQFKTGPKKQNNNELTKQSESNYQKQKRYRHQDRDYRHQDRDYRHQDRDYYQKYARSPIDPRMTNQPNFSPNLPKERYQRSQMMNNSRQTSNGSYDTKWVQELMNNVHTNKTQGNAEKDQYVQDKYYHHQNKRDYEKPKYTQPKIDIKLGESLPKTKNNQPEDTKFNRNIDLFPQQSQSFNQSDRDNYAYNRQRSREKPNMNKVRESFQDGEINYNNYYRHNFEDENNKKQQYQTKQETRIAKVEPAENQPQKQCRLNFNSQSSSLKQFHKNLYQNYLKEQRKLPTRYASQIEVDILKDRVAQLQKKNNELQNLVDYYFKCVGFGPLNK